MTTRLARQLVVDAKVMAIRAVARRHGVSWATVMGLVRSWADQVGQRRRRGRCRVLLVDETSMRRRHRYVTVLQNGETGELLAMVSHRNAQALHGFLAAQGRRWCAQVEVVVTDGSGAYRAAVEADLGHAVHVLDCFHVVRWFAAGLSAVRREVQRRQPAGEVTPVFDPEVFRARFALLRLRGRPPRTRSPRPAHPRLRGPPPPGRRLAGPPDTPRRLPRRGQAGRAHRHHGLLRSRRDGDDPRVRRGRPGSARLGRRDHRVPPPQSQADQQRPA